MTFAMLASLLWLMIPLFSIFQIVMVWSIRNLRPEMSRQGLQKLLVSVAMVKWCVAASMFAGSIAIAASLTNAAGQLGWVNENDIAALMVEAILLVLSGLVYWFLSGAVSSRTSVREQISWEPYLTAVLVGVWVLQLFWFGIWSLLILTIQWQLRNISIKNRQSMLLWTLTVACRSGLPLGPEVHRLSQFFWGRSRLRLIMLAENLDAGHPLSVCLERQVGLLPRRVLLLARVGEETHALGDALSLALDQSRNINDRQLETRSWESTWSFVVLPVMVLLLVSSFILVFIIPKFKKIFEDFGMALPAVTRSWIGMNDQLSMMLPLLTLLFTGATVSAVVMVWFKDRESDWPIIDEMFPRRNAPSVLMPLVLVIQTGTSLYSGIVSLLEVHPQMSVLKRLRSVLSKIDAGQNIWQVLQQTGLLNQRDYVLLKSAESAHNLPWALRFLATQIEIRKVEQSRFWMQVAVIVILLIVAIPCAYMVIALFMPLTHLIKLMA